MENICSPVTGKIVKLEEVPDDMFAQKLLGDGLAIQPENEKWYAPVNGTITMIYPTKHAIGITSDLGSELLIHIGLDTFDLKGAPFHFKVNVGDKVKKGDLILSVSLDEIIEKHYQTITPVLSTNKAVHLLQTTGTIQAGEILFQIEQENEPHVNKTNL